MTTLQEFKEIEAKATKGPLHIVEHSWAETSICDCFNRPICTLNINDYGDVTEDNQDAFEAIVRTHADKIAVSYSALPALIAVAEGMAVALYEASQDYDPNGFGRVLNKALAAFEAWKDNIEGEK